MISKYTQIIKESMRAVAVLEYNADVTIRQFGDKIAAVALRDGLVSSSVRAALGTDTKAMEDPEKQAALKQVLARFEEADPSKNKAYVPFIAKCYSAGGWGSKIEDILTKVRPALTTFMKLRQKNLLAPEHKDVMQFKTFLDFVDMVDSYAEKLVEAEAKDNAADEARGNAKEIYRDETVRIIIPLDKTAAIYYGQNTKWCTAGTEYNMFDHFSKDGPLFILIPAKPAYAGEKYQIHFESNQYMNERDNSVNLNEIIVDRFPNAAYALSEHAPRLNYIDRMPPNIMRYVLDLLTNTIRNEFAKAYAQVDDPAAREELSGLADTLKNFVVTRQLIQDAAVKFPAQVSATLDYDLRHIGNALRFAAFMLKYNEFAPYINSTNPVVAKFTMDFWRRLKGGLKMELLPAPGKRFKQWTIVETGTSA